MKTFIKEDIIIGWESEKCLHSANCVKELSSVFKPLKDPWIRIENATKQEIIDQIHKCPSGALTIVQ